MSDIDQAALHNGLLSRLCAADFAALSPHLTRHAFAKRDVLSSVGKPIERSYFLESGIASVVATTPEGMQTEVGIIGREGMVDVATVLGAATAPLEIFIQAEGIGFSMPSAALQDTLERRPKLRQLMLLFSQVFLIQVSYTALAAASMSIRARLARWLLMCADRTDGPGIPMTHEFLAVMLNVRRPGVTEAVRALESSKLIQARRGVIVVTDGAGLKQLAGESYGVPEATYQRLLSGDH